jgi:hypothetical protein
MHGSQQPNLWRRTGAVVVALLGLWLCSNAIIPLIEGFRTREVEFMNHMPGAIAIAVLLLGISIWLFSVAGRLWGQVPPSSSGDDSVA